jgi:hypothetical protein
VALPLISLPPLTDSAGTGDAVLKAVLLLLHLWVFAHLEHRQADLPERRARHGVLQVVVALEG